MEHKVIAVNWDGRRIELVVQCGGDIRKVAAAAHRAIKKLDERYVTYCIVSIDGCTPPWDVACG